MPTKTRFAWWHRSVGARGGLGTLADVVGLVAATGVAAQLFGVTWSQTILAASLSALTLASVLVAWRLENALRGSTTHRRARVCLAMPKFSRAVGDLSRAQNAAAEGGAPAPQLFATHMETAGRTAADAFSILTKQVCRVTMQEVYSPEKERYAVRVVAASYQLGTGPTRSTVDYVDDNTDFKAILLEGENRYVCNDLPAELAKGYQNSHWTPERLRTWDATGTYPYRSTAVWPIRGRVSSTSSAEGEWDILGFLSVDAPDTDAFDEELVGAVGEAFAYAAYAGLRSFQALREEV